MKFGIKKRMLILAGLLIVMTALFFVLRQKKATTQELYSSALSESTLPVVWVNMCGRDMNCMRGHVSDVGVDETYDTLTLLPEDRHLTLRIAESESKVVGAKYEVRSGNLEELIEATEIKNLEKSDNGIILDLPFQNLLVNEKEYRLDLILTTADKRKVHYYSRIRLCEDMTIAEQMLDLVTEFSDRNFNYDEAKENTMYVETDGSADDTQLAYTNLKSTFTNLAYNNLKFTRLGENDLRLTVYDGNSGEIEQKYIVSRELSSGKIEYFEVSETYTLRMGAVRLYMLNFSRRIREIFTGKDAISGKRIILGINDENDLQAMSNREETHTFFVTTRDLWMYSKEKTNLKCIFSFRSNDQAGMVDAYAKHNIRMLEVDDAGNLTFIVYGYMNRGEHEGAIGISYMYYDADEDVVFDKFFIPIASTYEMIEKNVEELAHLGDNNMFYLKVGTDIYAVDVMSGSFIVLATDLADGTFAVSKNQEKIAWQEDRNKIGSNIVHIMDMNSGQKQELRSDANNLLRPKGFIGRDVVISVHDIRNEWNVNGKLYDIPASTVEITDDQLVVLKRYEREGMFLTDINVHDGRVSMNILRKIGENYITDSEDTIVSSVEQPDRRENIGTYQAEDKLKVYYIVLSDESRGVSRKAVSGTNLIYDGVTIDGISSGNRNLFTAYGDGKLVYVADNISDAIIHSYDGMGTVRYQGHVVYSRPGTVTTRVVGDYLDTAQTILEKRAAGELLDISGIGIRQAVYFVNMKCPVLAYSDGGTPLYIYAYDRTTISCLNLTTNTREYFGMDEAEAMFEAGHRDFSCDFTLN